MNKKRATKSQALDFIQYNFHLENLGTYHIRVILNHIFPFTWNTFCKEENLNPEILMDDHEKMLRRDKTKELIK